MRNFSETIRTGRHLGRGREILPPMPIPMYKNFTDADLAAIFSYLQSIPAVKNRVPEPRPPALVLGFGNVSEHQITRGIRTLAKAVRRQTAP